jgi:hypothetical protein
MTSAGDLGSPPAAFSKPSGKNAFFVSDVPLFSQLPVSRTLQLTFLPIRW